LSLFYHDASSMVRATFISLDASVITRRHTLGLLAAASLLPQRSFANVAYPKTQLRTDLAKHFTDAGTSGTFVA
jgi:beta-lactamase class D